MNIAIVKEIEELTTQLGKIVVSVEPATPADWDAMEKMQAAHKQLRSIDIAEITERPPRAGFTK